MLAQLQRDHGQTSPMEEHPSLPSEPPLDDLGPWAMCLCFLTSSVWLHLESEQRTYLPRESIVPNMDSGPREAICFGLWPQELAGKPSFDQPPLAV